MALSLFPSLLPTNLSSLAPGLEGFCQSYYGRWKDSRACTHAIWKLPQGLRTVTYTIDQEPGPQNLPLQVQSGDCTIQVELAGPRIPGTISLVPQDVISMAEMVQASCVQGTGYVGGFVALDMEVLKNWVVAEETSLDAPYPISTAFVTVTVTEAVPYWQQVGDFDPHIAWLLAQEEFAAIPSAFLPRFQDKLRRRGERFMAQYRKMTPRGQRIPWWRNPDTKGAEDRNTTTSSPSPQLVGGNRTDTVSRRRRSRALIAGTA